MKPQNDSSTHKRYRERDKGCVHVNDGDKQRTYQKRKLSIFFQLLVGQLWFDAHKGELSHR